MGNILVHSYITLGVDGLAVHDAIVQGADPEATSTRVHNQAADRRTRGSDCEAAQEGDHAEGSRSET